MEAYSFNNFEVVLQEQSSLYETGNSSDTLTLNGKKFRYRAVDDGYLEMNEEGLVHRMYGSFLEKMPLVDNNCPYCASEVYTPEELGHKDQDDNPSFYSDLTAFEDKRLKPYRTRYQCINCGWWGIEMGGHYYGEDYGKHIRYHISGTQKKFSVSDSDVNLDDLVFWLKRNNKEITKVDPFKFEELIADCLRNLYSECEVKLVGGRKDRGIDIYIAQKNDFPILVQVKRRSQIDKSESVSTIRSLNGVLFREGTPYGAIVTTSRKFTQPVFDEIESVQAKKNPPFERYSMKLIAHAQVTEMLTQLKNDEKSYAEHMRCKSLSEWLENYYSKGDL